MKRDDSIWLVKSGGRILGPFTQAAIARQIEDKEISMVDEVMEPFRRWHMIRDCIAFADILETLRASGNITDDVTSSAGGITVSVTGSVTEKMAAGFGDESGEALGGYSSQFKEIVYESVPATEQSGPRPLGAGRFQTAAALDQRRLRQQAEKSSNWMWGLTLAVFFAVVLLIGVKRIWKSEGALSITNPGSVGLTLFLDGDHTAALDYLKRAYTYEPARKDIWFPLAVLLTQLEGQTVESRRLLQKVVEERDGRRVDGHGVGLLTRRRYGQGGRASQKGRRGRQGILAGEGESRRGRDHQKRISGRAANFDRNAQPRAP
jgi:hypothetical protein